MGIREPLPHVFEEQLIKWPLENVFWEAVPNYSSVDRGVPGVR